MADLARFHLGDVGGTIIGTIIENGDVVNIATATNIRFYFKSPRGNVIEKAGSLYTAGTDGKAKYTVESGFFDIKDKSLLGTWSYEVKCTIGSWTGTSESAQFLVDDVLRQR
jgi:hypothetical protein